MATFKDLTGNVYTRLRVLERAEDKVAPSGRRRPAWRCLCDPELGGCGREVVTTSDSLTGKHSKSCGCLKREVASVRARSDANKRRGGLSLTVECKSWRAMLTRCYTEHNPSFPQYGGRGIYVCARWRESFADFLADMGSRPSDKTSIDRFPDNDGGYTCGKCDECVAKGAAFNCRWADDDEQVRNQRRNVMLTHDGRTMCREDWARELGITGSALAARLESHSVADALTQPKRAQEYPATRAKAARVGPEYGGAVRIVEYMGRSQSLAAWCRELGLKYRRTQMRLARGYPLEFVFSDESWPGVKPPFAPG